MNKGVVVGLAVLFILMLLCGGRPVIDSVTPSLAFNDQVVDLAITGDKFVKPTVKLIKSGEDDLIASDVQLLSKKEIQASFDLNGVAVGAWDLVIANRGRTEASTTLPGALLVEYPPPVLSGVEPASAEENATVALKLTGAKLRPGIVVQLMQADQVIATASGVEVTSPTEAKASLDLKGVAPGSYDLVVINADGKKVTLANAFGVVKAAATQGPLPNLRFVGFLLPIFFDFDKAAIRDDQTTALFDNITKATENPDMYVVIGGNADERGSSEYNIALSDRRAQAVREFILGNSELDPANVIIYAYGESKPIKLGDSEAAWAFNRRVDISLWEKIPEMEEAVPTEETYENQ